jgi:hypothetical protein
VTISQGDFVDYPWIAIEPNNGTIYVSWISLRAQGLSFCRSFDGGHSFDAVRTITMPQEGLSQPALAAGPQGLVCVIYKTLLPGSGSGSSTPKSSSGTAGTVSTSAPVPNDQVEVIISTDGGNSFNTPLVLDQVPDQPMPAPQVMLTTGPIVAIDARRSSIYVAYAAYVSRTNTTEIIIRQSHNRGQSWSDPLHLNGYPNTDQASYFQPQLSINESGDIAVSAFVLQQGQVDVVLAVSTNRGASFKAYQRVTNQSFNPAWGPAGGKHGSWWIGDFQGIASSHDQFYAIWNDSRTGVNHMDLFIAAVDVREPR